MAVAINADAANIPAVNFVEQGSDPSAPGSGHAIIYVKSGVVYVRRNAGSPVAVGGVPALTTDLLAVGDGDGNLSALSAGAEGAVPTRQADGSILEVVPDAPSGGDVVQIDHVAVTAGGAATIAFADIPGTYHHLRLYLAGRTDRAGQTVDSIAVQFNADTGAHYGAGYISSLSSSAPTAAEANSATSGFCAFTSAATASAGIAGMTVIDIPDYAGTTWRKCWTFQTALNLALTTGNHRQNLGAGLWDSTSAITGIVLLSTNGANFLEGTTATLYGLK